VENLDLLFPKVRAKLLRALFFDPRSQMYVRELARRCDVALSAVQEELANLVDADLLRRRSDGFHVFYRANRKHAMFVDLQQLVIKSARTKAVPRRRTKRRRWPRRSRRSKPNEL
jgi:predicted transcriptional regulator